MSVDSDFTTSEPEATKFKKKSRTYSFQAPNDYQRKFGKTAIPVARLIRARCSALA
jgi:hypothetical protein